MATITKRGPFQFQAKVRRGKVTKTKTFSKLKDARDWAPGVESELTRGVFVDRTQLEQTTLGEALTCYLRDLVPTLKSRVSVESRVKMWLKDPLANKRLSTLNTADFSEWTRQRLSSVVAGTARRVLSTIGATFKMVRDDWGQPLDPLLLTPVLKRLKVNNYGGRRLKPDEEEALLREAGAYSFDATLCIILALDSGMRRGEIALLKWDQVDFDAHVIRLRAGDRHGNFLPTGI